MRICCYYCVLDRKLCVQSNHRVFVESTVDPCAEELYFRRAIHGHDHDEEHIAELVKSLRQGHTGRNRARSVALSVENHSNNTSLKEHRLEILNMLIES